VQAPLAFHVPRPSATGQGLLPRQLSENREKEIVQLVIVRGAEIAVGAVPAPLAPVIPVVQVRHETRDPLVEPLPPSYVPGLRVQVVETEQTEQEPVQHSGERIAGILLVEDLPALLGADAPRLHVPLKDAG